MIKEYTLREEINKREDMSALLKTAVLAILIGSIYTLLVTPEATYAFGFHVYFLLAIASATSAFIARFIINIRSEKVILLTTAGILVAIISPVFFDAYLIQESIFDMIISKTFITLFFAGHAAMIGSFTASLLRRISLKNKFGKLPEKARSKSYYRYPATD